MAVQVRIPTPLRKFTGGQENWYDDELAACLFADQSQPGSPSQPSRKPVGNLDSRSIREQSRFSNDNPELTFDGF